MRGRAGPPGRVQLPDRQPAGDGRPPGAEMRGRAGPPGRVHLPDRQPAGDVRPPGAEMRGRAGPLLRVHLPDRQRPGDPSPWASGELFEGAVPQSVNADPRTTGHPPPLANWVDRLGDVRPPGAEVRERAGPYQRGRLPDRHRAEESSPRARERTRFRVASTSAWSDPWATSHWPPRTTRLDRKGSNRATRFVPRRPRLPSAPRRITKRKRLGPKTPLALARISR